MNETEFVKTITESRHCGKVFIGNELTHDEEELARENNLVVVFGYSDDCAEFRGAIDDEVDCYDGGRVFEKNGFYIDAKWCIGNTAWIYDTNIPHESFMVWDNDGTAYCLAIVFSMDSINRKQDNTSEISKTAIEYVVEFCSECENENEFRWDVDVDGYKAYCPHCGAVLMLCDECTHRNDTPIKCYQKDTPINECVRTLE